MAVVRMYDIKTHGKSQVDEVLNEIKDVIIEKLGNEGTLRIRHKGTTISVKIESDIADLNLDLSLINK